MVQFFDPKQEAEIKRRRRMAEMLMKQGGPKPTEVISGYAVPQSGLEQLARGLAGGIGSYQAATADNQEKELAQKRQELLAEALSKGSKQEAAQVLGQDPEMAGTAVKMAFPDSSSLGGATGAIADRLIAQGVDPLQAILIAKSGLGAGRTFDTGSGMVQPMAGAPEAGGAMKYGEKMGEQQAVLATAPQIESAKDKAKSMAEKQSLLNESTGLMPQLDATVDRLGKLADKATYTWAGRAVGEAVRQTGGTRESDIARTEYQSEIDNNILPLLRQTFGAQFTQKEGESLKATLGDVNKAPAEKKAVLRAFINQKQEQIKTLQRQTGQTPAPTDPLAAARDAIAKGAPRDAVIQRLQQNGIDATGL